MRWGILGTGAVAWLFAADLRHVANARLVAVGSRSAGRARALASRFGAERAHGSYAALLDDGGIDVLYVATVNTLHREHAMAALTAGMAVLCEKPFTMTAAEARDVVAVARRAGVFCMEAMWMRFAPAFRQLRARIARGDLGEVRQVAASLGFRFRHDPQHRVFDPAVGGGALLDLGVYPLSLCAALLGAPVEVRARARVGTSGVDEHVVVHLRHRSGAEAVVTTSVRERLSNDAEVTGSRARARLGAPLYFPPTLEVADAGAASGPWPGASLVRSLAGRVGERARRWSRWPGSGGIGYHHEAREVMRCLAEGRTESPEMTLDETVGVMETLDAARAARDECE